MELDEIVAAIRYNHDRWGDKIPQQIERLEQMGAIDSDEAAVLVASLTDNKE